MENKKTLIIVAVGLALMMLVGIGFIGLRAIQDRSKADNSVEEVRPLRETPVPQASDVPVNQPAESGEYILYDKNRLTDGKNVIFFAAVWCPSCRSLDNDINANLNRIPEDVTILKADYDKEQELKRKYGVTIQHTLVQVDKEGNEIKKWNGLYKAESLSEVLVEIV